MNAPSNALEPKLLLDPVHFLALGFGAGLSPRAPGTVATLVAVPMIMFIASWGFIALAVAAVLMFVSGVYICGRSARKLGVHDHPGIVWDEFTGLAVTLLGVPMEWYWVAAGFVLFRFFDIVKPWPIREADHSLSGGLGIMLDDVIAGIFSCAILHALMWAL